MYCECAVLGIGIENGTRTGIVTRIVTRIVTENTIGIEEGTGPVKGGAVVAVTVVHAKNEAVAGRRESMIGENETTKVTMDTSIIHCIFINSYPRS